jgi:hypothetical protein
MAKLRPQPTPDPGPDVRNRRISLSAVLDGPRPGHADPDLDRLWREVGRDVAMLTMGTAFDPRRIFHCEGLERERMQAEMRVFLNARLADDPRVMCDA